jgi:hypothetical protein
LAQIASAGSALDLLKAANQQPAKEDVGSKSFNSLILQSLSTKAKGADGVSLFMAP